MGDKKDGPTVTAAPTDQQKSQTELEMEAGRKQSEYWAKPGARRSYPKPDPTVGGLGDLVGEQFPLDPDVELPADVQRTIARGEEAFKRQKRSRTRGLAASDVVPSIITSVIDQEVQDRRDANLDARELPTKGNRRQPPMTTRLRVIMILVDRLVSDGIPFRVGPNSKMNKAVRLWLNAKAKRSSDNRKSRRKQIGPTAVRALLKQVREEGRPVTKTKSSRKTTQDVAREQLRKLRESRTPPEPD
jgi:hypothetical protein